MKQKRSIALEAGILSVFSLSQCLGGITPVIAKIGEAFPFLPSTTIMYVSTIASLTSIPASLIAGQIAGKKMSLRSIAIFSTVLIMVCGCIPAILPAFPVMLLSRALFGFGLGAVSVLGNPLVSAWIDEEKRPAVLGTGTFAAFGGAMILQLFAGALADLRWNYAFLTHALAALPLILMIFCLPREGKITESPSASAAASGRHIPGIAILACLLFGFCTLMIAPLLVGSSLLASRLTQSASLMAAVSICYSIGCMLGGMGFGEIYKRTGNRSMSAALILTAVGMAGSAFAGSILLLCIFIALAGLGFGCLMSSVMTVIGSVTEGPSVAAATSFMMVASNVFTFFCSTWMSLIGRLGGDATYMPLKIGAVIYTILAAILFIHPLYGNNNSFQTSLSKDHLIQKL